MKSSSHERRKIAYLTPRNQKLLDEYVKRTGDSGSQTINEALEMFWASQSQCVKPKLNPA